MTLSPSISTPSPVIPPTSDVSNLTKFFSVTQHSIIPILAAYGVFVSSSNGESIPKKAPVSPSRSGFSRVERPFAPPPLYLSEQEQEEQEGFGVGWLFSYLLGYVTEFGGSGRTGADVGAVSQCETRDRSLGGTALGRERDSLIKRRYHYDAAVIASVQRLELLCMTDFESYSRETTKAGSS
ncbi:hypothetical protein C8J56DRAFT_896503 [Mycena floridula]|nr:hypothetical protein C8J56DRAFT_896503 [Mycena floridula]